MDMSLTGEDQNCEVINISAGVLCSHHSVFILACVGHNQFTPDRVLKCVGLLWLKRRIYSVYHIVCLT